MRVLATPLSPAFELIFGDTIPKFCRTHMRVALLSFSLYFGDVFLISGAPWYFSRNFICVVKHSFRGDQLVSYGILLGGIWTFTR